MRLRRVLTALVAVFFFSGTVSAQEVPSTAGYSLYSLETISGDPDNHWYTDRLRSFYLNALRYGRISGDFSEEYPMVSPEGAEVAIGDLVEFARSYQCSYLPTAPARIIYRHLISNWHKFFAFGTNESTYNSLWTFLPMDFDWEANGETETVRIPLRRIRYVHPQGANINWKDQAVSDPVAFRDALDSYLSLDQYVQTFVEENPEGLYENTPGTAYIGATIYIEITSADMPTRCEYDEVSKDWKVVFEDGFEPVPDDRSSYYDYQPEAPQQDIEDPQTTTDISQWRWRDHDFDNVPNLYDPDYQPDGDADGDNIPNKYDPDYDSSPPPSGIDSDQDGIPDQFDTDDDNDGVLDVEDPTPQGDLSELETELPDSLSRDDFCEKDVETGSCVVIGSDQEIDYAETTQRVQLLLQAFVDTSALASGGACPPFVIKSGTTHLDIPDVEIEIDCSDLRNYVGSLLVISALWGAVRMSFT